MPNHITSEVEITGTKEQIAKLIKDTKIVLDHDTDENQFDFNGIVKMPPELMITSGSNVDLGMAAYNQAHYDKQAVYSWWSERYPNVTGPESLKKALESSDNEMDKKALIEGKQALDNLRKYGYKDWYDWSNSNWGTKWNAYDVRYIAHNETTLVVKIETAWDTPRGIWSALEEKGFTVKGVMYGEMEGYDYIGEGSSAFEAYVDVQVEYVGEAA